MTDRHAQIVLPLIAAICIRSIEALADAKQSMKGKNLCANQLHLLSICGTKVLGTPRKFVQLLLLPAHSQGNVSILMKLRNFYPAEIYSGEQLKLALKSYHVFSFL